MDVIASIAGARRLVARARSQGHPVGLVPTMGALHAGHRALTVEARRRCGYVVLSIFVNPTQFGPGEDFERYPRTLDSDLAACRRDGVDLVFCPDVSEMYPEPGLTTVHVARLTEGLCGADRPGHFDGVATVVTKLFNAVTPDQAFFGEKDYQQLVVIRRLASDLDLPVEIVACPTVREPDGLAVSSRNQYLDRSERRQATALYRSMCWAAEAVAGGTVKTSALIAGIEQEIRAPGPAVIEYVRIVDPHTLQELDRIDGPARICLAVRLGKCRLIDNLAVDAGGAVG